MAGADHPAAWCNQFGVGTSRPAGVHTLTPAATAPIARPREDAEAERLFAEHSERIYRYCRRRLRSQSEAEDAVQLTYLYALRALRRGIVPTSESAWLYSIAQNVCRWQHRTAARRPLGDSAGLETLASPDHEDARDLLAELPGALESLPERQRQALLLREWRGLSADEIAHELDLSAAATHALLTRARRALAQALTVPGRAAAGFGTLVYELRSWIKAAVGGLSAKAAATTVAVVGVGGGLAVDRTLADDGSTGRPVKDTPPVVEVGTSLVTTSRARVTSRGGAVGEERARPSARVVVRPRPEEGGVAPPAEGPASEHTSEPTTGAADPRSVLPAAPPLVPEVEVPTVDLPPVDLPPVDVPPIDLPGDVIPTVEVEPVDLPPVDLPPVEPPPLPPLLP